jgi:trimethylamine--corrinoid protein Co-methyltransferase
MAVLMEIVRSGLPVALSSAPMAGLTSPITLAGTLVQLHAEELSGIALTQMLEPGTPVLYGGVPSMTDMHELDYVGGGVEFGLMNAAIAQLSRHIGVPCFNSAGVTEAKIPDMQAVYEKTFAICQCVLSGSNCIHHAAGMLESMMKVNYSQMVMDNEIAGMAMRALRGIELDEDRLATDTINAVGPGGSYIATKHTVKYMRTEFYEPVLADRHNYDTWRHLQVRDIRKRATREAKKILKEHRPIGIPPEIDQEIRNELRIYPEVSRS